jgi:hypothetical protein
MFKVTFNEPKIKGGPGSGRRGHRSNNRMSKKEQLPVGVYKFYLSTVYNGKPLHMKFNANGKAMPYYSYISGRIAEAAEIKKLPTDYSFIESARRAKYSTEPTKGIKYIELP